MNGCKPLISRVPANSHHMMSTFINIVLLNFKIYTFEASIKARESLREPVKKKKKKCGKFHIGSDPPPYDRKCGKFSKKKTKKSLKNLTKPKIRQFP